MAIQLGQLNVTLSVIKLEYVTLDVEELRQSTTANESDRAAKLKRCLCEGLIRASRIINPHGDGREEEVCSQLFALA